MIPDQLVSLHTKRTDTIQSHDLSFVSETQYLSLIFIVLQNVSPSCVCLTSNEIYHHSLSIQRDPL